MIKKMTANPAAPWEHRHGECAFCEKQTERLRALEAELAYRRSYDTGDFTSVGKVIGDMQRELNWCACGQCEPCKLTALKDNYDRILSRAVENFERAEKLKALPTVELFEDVSQWEHGNEPAIFVCNDKAGSFFAEHDGVRAIILWLREQGGGRESGSKVDTADRGGVQLFGRPANGPDKAAARPAAHEHECDVCGCTSIEHCPGPHTARKEAKA